MLLLVLVLQLQSIIDFRFAGNKVGAANTTGRFMIPPTVTTDEKVGLTHNQVV